MKKNARQFDTFRSLIEKFDVKQFSKKTHNLSEDIAPLQAEAKL